MRLAATVFAVVLLSVARVPGQIPAERNAQDAGTRGPVEFNRDIRPLLSDRCYTCHGPDQARRRTKLRFDVEADAKQDLGGRFAIVPGDVAKSEMIRRITAAEPARRMPPVASGRTLTPAEIDLIQRWIEQGAKWEKHWSFNPPRRASLPDISNRAWARNDIDFFVVKRLEQEGLAPAPEADRATLIRRVSLDLTGLPPTPAEVDAFLNDKSRSAYEKVVDRLLSSPRYGERMAAQWLDAARYADTNGYQTDAERYMWRWRDWVIEAFNRNLPFDEFALEQIAGDMLPHPTLDQRIATGFNRNHRGNGEGRHHSRGIRRRICRRSCRDDVDGLDGAHPRLRPLPRPQVRPLHPERVLPALFVLQQYSGARQGQQVREFGSDDSGADRGATVATGRNRPRAGSGRKTFREPSGGIGKRTAKLGGGARQVGASSLVDTSGSRRILSARRQPDEPRDRPAVCAGGADL